MTFPPAPLDRSALRNSALKRWPWWLAMAAAGALGQTTPTAPSRDAAAEELLRAEQRGQLCSGANVTGSGLRGDYFDNEQWQGKPLLTRLDPTLDFNKSLDWPANLGSAPKSVRWSGWIKPPMTGRYRFHLDWPGARIAVGREDLLGGKAKPGASVELFAGRFYPILVEVPRTATLSQGARLEWTGPHGLRFPLPKALLFPPTDTVSPSTASTAVAASSAR